MGAEEWTQYQGPRGGHGWRNGVTGKVLYQEAKPVGRNGDEGEGAKSPRTPNGSPVPSKALISSILADVRKLRVKRASEGVSSSDAKAISKKYLDDYEISDSIKDVADYIKNKMPKKAKDALFDRPTDEIQKIVKGAVRALNQKSSAEPDQAKSKRAAAVKKKIGDGGIEDLKTAFMNGDITGKQYDALARKAAVDPVTGKSYDKPIKQPESETPADWQKEQTPTKGLKDKAVEFLKSVGAYADSFRPLISEPVTDGGDYNPDPTVDEDGDGITDAARCGVGGKSMPPPPKIPRMNNLTKSERQAETTFATMYEADPDGMADKYRQDVYDGEIGDGPNIFNTDDAKELSPHYNPRGVEKAENLASRGRNNLAVHQTANALAKRAFVRHLADVAGKKKNGEPKTILVTAGGVAAGKGFALSRSPDTNNLMGQSDAVWDTAGEQNSTELAWVQHEAEKLGFKVTYAYIHANPETTWDRALGRAAGKGRMVDGRLFSESYDLGAKNFSAFHKRQAESKNSAFIFIDNSGDGNPTLVEGMPDSALKVDAEKVRHRSYNVLSEADVPDYVKRGGGIGLRVWKDN